MDHFTHRRWLALGVVAAIVFPLAIGTAAYMLDPLEWRWDDWGGTANSVGLAAIFFLLAWLTNREAETRAAAVANGALLSTVGQLTMTSARTFGGFDEQALRVSTDALSALQYYPLADEDERGALLGAIAGAYTNLSFGSLSRAPVLPRSTWDKLEEGARSVRTGLDELPPSSLLLPSEPHDPGREMARDPKKVSRHIEFVMNVAQALRRRGTENLHGDSLDAAVMIEDLEFLYRDELTVIKDWRILEEGESDLTLSIELHDASSEAIAHWYSPWYVKGDVGKPEPTNVVGEDLQEPAGQNQIEDYEGLSRHPRPLRYSEFPVGLRTARIRRMADILSASPLRLATCLVYDAVFDNGRLVRTVVDGNHRVAAARLVSGGSEGRSEGNQGDVFLLSYVIRETRPVTNHASTELRGEGQWIWHGFTPDIALLRAVIEGRGDTTRDEGKPAAVMVGKHSPNDRADQSGNLCLYCSIRSQG